MERGPVDWKRAFAQFAWHYEYCAVDNGCPDERCDCGLRPYLLLLEQEQVEARMAEEAAALQSHYGGA